MLRWLPRYAQFVEAVELGSRDNLEFIKSKAIRALGALLAAKPEQEGRLLAALCNKLGDPSRKLASKVSLMSALILWRMQQVPQPAMIHRVLGEHCPWCLQLARDTPSACCSRVPRSS